MLGIAKCGVFLWFGYTVSFLLQTSGIVFIILNGEIINFVNNKQCNCLGLSFSLVNKIA